MRRARKIRDSKALLSERWNEGRESLQFTYGVSSRSEFNTHYGASRMKIHTSEASFKRIMLMLTLKYTDQLKVCLLCQRIQKDATFSRVDGHVGNRASLHEHMCAFSLFALHARLLRIKEARPCTLCRFTFL